MLAWLKAHKALVALLSLIGSIAGVGFSAVDLNDAMKKKGKK
jgi:hypothetical protein